MERALLWLAGRIHAGHRWIAVACLAATVAAAAFVLRMPVKTDLLDALPEGNPAIAAFTGFLRDFGAMDGLIVVVESAEPAPDVVIGVAEAIGTRLAASPLIASVDYNALRSGARLAGRHFPLYLDRAGIGALSERLSPEGIRRQVRKNREALLSPLSSPFESEMIARDPVNLREIAQASFLRRAPVEGLDLSTGYYLDRSHTMAFLMARPRGSARDTAFIAALRREVGDIAATALRDNGSPPGVTAAIAGGYARAAEAAGVIGRDMIVSFASSFVMVLLLIAFSLRPSLPVLSVFVLTLVAALAWTLLLAYLLFGALNIVTSVAAAMLIGLFVDYMIHTYKRFEEELREGSGPLHAMERTLAGTGKAIITGSLTTAAAFFSIVVTSFRGLHELGVVAGFGVFFCLLATLLLMTSLLSWMAHARPDRIPAGRPAGIPTGWAAGLVERRGKAIVLAALALLALGTAAAPRVRFVSSPESLGLKESAVQAVDRRIEGKLGKRGETMALVARAASEAELASDFDAMEKTGESWRTRGLVARVSSPGLLLPGPSAQQDALRALADAGLDRRFTGPSLEKTLRAEMDRQGLVPDPSLGAYAEGVAAALSLRTPVGFADLNRSGDPRAAYFYNPEKKAIAAHLSPPDGRWERPAVEAIRKDVRAMGPDFRLIGASVVFDDLRTTILWESGVAILLSVGANVFIVLLAFRRWRRVGLVMLPVTAGTLLTVGTMGAFGLPFNFFNVAAIGLIFGMGVDYGIYMLQAHAETGGGGREALARTGGNVVLCTATTIASCGSLATSHFRGIASIGSILSIGMLYCLLLTLLVLPVFLRPGGTAKARA